MRYRSFGFAAALVILVSGSLFGAQQEYAFATAEHGAWLALFQVRNGYLEQYDTQNFALGKVARQVYGNICPQGCVVPTQTSAAFGKALNITPALMPEDADNLRFVFVAPDDGGKDPFNNTRPGNGGAHLVMGSLATNGNGGRQTYDLQGSTGMPIAVLPTTPNVGAALLPDNFSDVSLWLANVALIAYATPDHKLMLDAWWIPQRQNGVNPSGKNLTSFTQPDGWDGNVSVAVRRETSADDATQPYGVYLAIHNGKAMSLGSAPIGQLLSDRGNAPPVFKWIQITPPDGLTPNSTVLVQKASDNRLFLYYLNAAGQMASYVISGNAGAPTTAPSDKFTLSGSMTRVPSVAFSLGPTSLSNPLPTQPNMTKTTVPVYRSIFWAAAQPQGDQVLSPAGSVVQYGLALREPLPAIENAQQIAIGIIDGPPPVPNENINLTGMGNFTTLGTTEYGLETETGTDSSFKFEGGGIIKLSTEGGIEGGVDSEAEIKVGYGRDKSKESVTTSVATYKSDAKAVNDGGKQQIDAAGVAFLYGALYTGYRYYFLDPAGNPIPGAADRTIVFPMQPQIRPYPFEFDPNGKGTIIPGELLSYVMNQPDFDALKRGYSSYTFQNGTPTLYFGWSKAGTYGESSSIMNTSTESKSIHASAEAMIGAGMHGEIGGWSAMIGAYVDATWTDTTSSTNKTQISSSVDFPALPETSGVYTRYGYYTVPLKGDAKWLNDLVAMLKAHPTTDNTVLLKALVGQDLSKPAAPLGTPWKFTYVILPSDYTFDEGGGASKAQTTGAVPLPSSLVARGIDSPQKLAQLQIAVTESARPRQVKRNPASNDPVPQNIRAMVPQLSTQEKSEIEAYYAAIHARRMTEFTRRHPNWKARDVAPPSDRAVQASATNPPAPKRIDFAALSSQSGALKSRPRPTASTSQP